MGDNSVALVIRFVRDQGTELWELGQTLGTGCGKGGCPVAGLADKPGQLGAWESIEVEGCGARGEGAQQRQGQEAAWLGDGLASCGWSSVANRGKKIREAVTLLVKLWLLG